MRTFITAHLAPVLLRTAQRRAPDVTIGGSEDPYLRRWFVIPRNPVFNIYLHNFLRSDDDRALHDHPWPNLSILLRGRYNEHTIAAGGTHVRTERKAGDMAFRWPGAAHRVELFPGHHEPGPDGRLRRRPQGCWTLFLTGPRVREWGFHCARGWRHWRDFTSADGRSIGRGCGEEDGAPAFTSPAGLSRAGWTCLTLASGALIAAALLMTGAL